MIQTRNTVRKIVIKYSLLICRALYNDNPKDFDCEMLLCTDDSLKLHCKSAGRQFDSVKQGNNIASAEAV